MCGAKQPLISVVIPVYNVEAYLARCLDSVIGNTYSNLEIICVNDCSPDHCLDILRSYARKDARIRIVDKPKNGGLPAARRSGVDAATGDFIAHVDADDWVHRQYFEVLIRAWEQSGRDADIIAAGFVSTGQFREDGEIRTDALQLRICGWPEIREDASLRSFVWGRLFAADLARDLDTPPEISIHEDQLFNLMAMARKEDVKLVEVRECPIYYYFQRPDSMTHQMTFQKGIPFWLYLVTHREDFPQGRIRNAVRWVCITRAMDLRYSTMFQNRLNPQNRMNFNPHLRRLFRELFREEGFSKQSLAFWCFWKCPPLYRAARILRDPTLRTWEKYQKEALRQHKQG